MEELKPKEEQLINLLIAGHSVSDAAKQLKISRNFIYDSMERPAVKSRYNSLLNDLKTDSEHKLSTLYQKAVKAVERCLDSENDQVSLKTALFLLDKLDKQSLKKTNPEEIEADRRQAEALKNLTNIF